MIGPERIWFTKYGDYNLEPSDRADDVEYVRADLVAPAAPPDGGPAYPVMWEYAGGETGMSLRDAAAIAALPGVMARMHEDIQSLGSPTFPANVSTHAYRIADALLAARGSK